MGGEVLWNGELATVVTGASSGIGRELSLSLAAQGRGLVLVARRNEALAATRKECVAAGLSAQRCVAVNANVSEAGSGQYIVERTLEVFGGIAAIVNNAGMARFGAVDRGTVVEMFETNVIGPAELIEAAVPQLRNSKGTVVNVGSIGGLLALPGRASYGASKAAINHLTRSLARQYAPDVRVNAVVPGAVDTEMYDNVGLDDAAVDALRVEMVRTTPLGRMGRPRDVVPWIEMLLGPAAEWMTGALIVVDGGRSC